MDKWKLKIKETENGTEICAIKNTKGGSQTEEGSTVQTAWYSVEDHEDDIAVVLKVISIVYQIESGLITFEQ